MENIKKGLRLLLLVLLLVMAAFGIGITGNILNNNRERYMDKEIKRERPDRKDEEENEAERD
jgi:hypothetical protein